MSTWGPFNFWSDHTLQDLVDDFAKLFLKEFNFEETINFGEINNVLSPAWYNFNVPLPDLHNEVNWQKKLWQAAQEGDVDTLEQCIEHLVNINEVDENGFTAFDYAFQKHNFKKDYELLVLLLEAGALVKDHQLIALQKEYSEGLSSDDLDINCIYVYFKAGIDFNQLGVNNYCPLLNAIEKNSETAIILQAYGAGLPKSEWQKLQAGFLKYICSGTFNFQYFKMFLNAGAGVNVIGSTGLRPLDHALTTANFDTIRALANENARMTNTPIVLEAFRKLLWKSIDTLNFYEFQLLLKIGLDIPWKKWDQEILNRIFHIGDVHPGGRQMCARMIKLLTPLGLNFCPTIASILTPHSGILSLLSMAGVNIHKQIFIKFRLSEASLGRYNDFFKTQDFSTLTSSDLIDFLIYAVRNNHNILPLLTSLNQRLGVQETSGWGPLHHAAFVGNVEAVRILRPLQNHFPNVTSPLHIAVAQGHLQVVNCLLDDTWKMSPHDVPVNVYQSDLNGMTALHYAAKIGSEEMVNRILLAYVTQSLTPEAFISFKKKMRSTLVSQAEINALIPIETIAAVDNMLNGVLHHAVYSGSLTTVNRILELHPVHTGNIEGRTPLEIAIELGSLEMTNVLIQDDTSKYKTKKSYVSTLHIAIATGRLDLVDCVLALSLAKTVCYLNGDTALHCAVKCAVKNPTQQNLLILKRLLEYYPDHGTVNVDNDTALEIALQSGCVEVIVLFICEHVRLGLKTGEFSLSILESEREHVILKELLYPINLDLILDFLRNSSDPFHNLTASLIISGRIRVGQIGGYESKIQGFREDEVTQERQYKALEYLLKANQKIDTQDFHVQYAVQHFLWEYKERKDPRMSDMITQAKAVVAAPGQKSFQSRITPL